VSGEANLYEWENGQVYLLHTFPITSGGTGSGGGLGFVDSSASGNDVFIVTTEQLDPHDTDPVQDLYDLRVGGGFPGPPPPPIPCDIAADQCQATPTPTPGASSPATESVSGAGNPPLQTPRCPKGKVRRNGKCVPKKHHKKAHKRAANSNRGGQK
jgi:hypothetical protein